MNTNLPANSLISLLGQYNITLPQNAIEWRVVRNSDSQIGLSGHHILHGLVTQILTDGIVSWFLLGDHETLFFGHKDNFEPAKEEKPRSFTPRVHRAKPLDPRLLKNLEED